MLILILINVQCLQNVVFSIEKHQNSQNYLSSDSHNPIKITSIAKFAIVLTWGNFRLPMNTNLVNLYHHDKMLKKKILKTGHEKSSCIILGQIPLKFTICSKKGNFLRNYIRIFLDKLECFIIKISLAWIVRSSQYEHNYIDTYLHPYVLTCTQPHKNKMKESLLRHNQKGWNNRNSQ